MVFTVNTSIMLDYKYIRGRVWKKDCGSEVIIEILQRLISRDNASSVLFDLIYIYIIIRLREKYFYIYKFWSWALVTFVDHLVTLKVVLVAFLLEIMSHEKVNQPVYQHDHLHYYLIERFMLVGLTFLVHICSYSLTFWWWPSSTF